MRFRKLEVLHNVPILNGIRVVSRFDAPLNRSGRWGRGPGTVQEDTYVDCPTYEQVLG